MKLQVKYDGIFHFEKKNEMMWRATVGMLNLANRYTHTHICIDTPLDRQPKDNKWKQYEKKVAAAEDGKK